MTNDRHLAEDLVQEAVAVAWSKVDQFDPMTSFEAWTSRIVRNLALNARRKISKRATLTLDHPDAASIPAARDEPSPIDALGTVLPNQQHFDDQVLAVLSSLSAPARSCLLLRTVNGLDYERISELLEIPAGTAMSHVHRSRQAMRKSLHPECVNHAGRLA